MHHVGRREAASGAGSSYEGVKRKGWEHALFGIEHERREAVTSLGLLGYPGSVVLGCASLRAVEDSDLLLLQAAEEPR